MDHRRVAWAVKVSFLHKGVNWKWSVERLHVLLFSDHPLVSAVRVVDNTLTIIIASAVGGAIATLMGFMLLKNFTLFVLSKLEEKKWVYVTDWMVFLFVCLFYNCFILVHQIPQLVFTFQFRQSSILMFASFYTCLGVAVYLDFWCYLIFFPCSKECLVTSSGIDNTENGLSGSKAGSKPTPKKKWNSACEGTWVLVFISHLHQSVHAKHICINQYSFCSS